MQPDARSAANKSAPGQAPSSSHHGRRPASETETAGGSSSAAKIERYEKALREIGLPKHVPDHFNREEFWKHLAAKRSEVARDALGVTAEELILDAIK
jgi:hypothetical protein